MHLHKLFRSLIAILLLFVLNPARASHTLGGELRYEYVKDTLANNLHYSQYRIILELYSDCANGQPSAIEEDDPAFLSIFDGAGKQIYIDTGFRSAITETIPALYSNPCGISTDNFCLQKRTFIKNYHLLPNTTGYTISYQRCCRVSAITNFVNSGNTGVTYTCTIPAAQVNMSAKFKELAPHVICINKKMVFDHSATDADGDSLSYGLGPGLVGATSNNIKPYALAGPYDSIDYNAPYSGKEPLGSVSGLAIDAKTGILSGTPNLSGQFVVSVYCYEWRNGIVINIARREIAFLVTLCVTPKTSTDISDTAVFVDDIVKLCDPGEVYQSVSAPYKFTSLDNSVSFTKTGQYSFNIYTSKDTSCESDVRTIHIFVSDRPYCFVPNAFTPNGDNENDILKPILIPGTVMKYFKIFNRVGNLVFSTTDANYGWDGTYNGAKQPIAVYTWQVLYKNYKGEERLLKGNTTLIR